MAVFEYRKDHPQDQGEFEGALFALLMLGRRWFAKFVKASEGPLFARLLFNIYVQFLDGFLISKSDAVRLIGVEHQATAAHYIKRAVDAGLIEMYRSKEDRRQMLLVLTDVGYDAIREEGRDIAVDIQWATALMDGDDAKAHRLRPSLSEPFPGDAIAVGDIKELRRRPRPRRSKGWGATEAYDQKQLIASFTDTIRLVPTHVNAMHERAQAYAALRKFDEALADIDEAISKDGENAQSWWIRAEINIDAGKYERAVADADRALVLEPNELGPLLTRARAKGKLGRNRDALKDLETYIKHAPAEFAAIADRADVHERLGNFEQALGDNLAAKELVETVGTDRAAEVAKRLENDIARVRKKIAARKKRAR